MSAHYHIHRRVQRGDQGVLTPPFPGPPLFSCEPPPSTQPDFTDNSNVNCFLNCLICSLGQHFTDIKGSKYMLAHSLASKYARFVVLGRLMYWTPPPSDHWTSPF